MTKNALFCNIYFFKGWLTPVYVEKNCFCNIYFVKNAGFVGFCNILPAADLSHLFKMLLMLAAKEIRTESMKLKGNRLIYLVIKE